MPELSLSSVKSCSSLMMRRSLLLDIVVKDRRVYRGRSGWFRLEKMAKEPGRSRVCDTG